MNSALRGSAAHVFVESLGAPALDDADRHHLGRVLRLRDGQSVSASDGLGRWRMCRWSAGDLEPDGDVHEMPAPSRAVTVGFALPKGDKPEWIVQKLTEIGVDHIVLVSAERSVVRWDDKIERQMQRLQRVAREASMQSRRCRLPTIAAPATVATLAAAGGVALAEPGGARLGPAVATVLVGPEGGWTPTELAATPHTVSLGATILRVETAAVVAAARLAALRDDSATD